jgi:hypothetical protein
VAPFDSVGFMIRELLTLLTLLSPPFSSSPDLPNPTDPTRPKNPTNPTDPTNPTNPTNPVRTGGEIDHREIVSYIETDMWCVNVVTPNSSKVCLTLSPPNPAASNNPP